MDYKNIVITVLIINSIYATKAFAGPRENGLYIGFNTTCCGETTSYHETITNRDSTGRDLNETASSHKNTTIWPKEIKVGYKHFNNNRIEFFRRNTDIDINDGKSGTVSSKIIGLNYELGINSLASVNKKVLPFASFGAGWGTASTSSNHLALKSSDSREFDAAIGVHYQLGQHFDSTLSLHRRKIFLLEKDGIRSNANHVFSDGDIAVTIINAGISYHF